MDPHHQRALSALEPYILLSKSANSPRAAADLITQATSAPGTFVFAELYWTPNVQALKETAAEDGEGEHWRGYLKLLEVFCWGVWADYEGTVPSPGSIQSYHERWWKGRTGGLTICTIFFLDTAAKGSLPPLSDAQAFKLRQLTLISIFSASSSSSSQQQPQSSFPSSPSPSSSTTTTTTTNPSLTYPHLLSRLSLPSPRALESLLIASLSNGLLSGTLNPLHQRADISSVAPLRDLPPNSIPSLTATFSAWETRCQNVLADLEARVVAVKQEAKVRAERKRVYEGVREDLIEGVAGGGAEAETGKGKGKGDGSAGGAGSGGRGERKRGVSGETVSAGDGKSGRKRGGLFGRRG